MPRENGADKIEVHVAGFCFDLEHEDGPRCLIAHRTPNRQLYPDLWECGGGHVKAGETFPEALQRQFSEEFGLDIEVLFPYGDYFIPTAEGGIPGMRFVCSVEGGQEVVLDPQEHTQFAWVREEDLKNYEFIEGLAQDIAESFLILAEC
jgi:8-oxo-dGTP pyrophosphatase MutT (NUDIX family)